LLATLALLAPAAHASFLSGDALDTAADVIAWVALVIVPLVAIAVFWLVHILPEKIAEQKRHPQAKAIQVLCLLSLFFGGMLWPIAWLWAYTKPVFYKMAYGHDQLHPEEGEGTHGAGLQDRLARLEAQGLAEADLKTLRADIDALEAKVAGHGAA